MPEITPIERATRLKELQQKVHAGVLRSRNEHSRAVLGEIIPLLGYNPSLCAEGQRCAHILSGGRYTVDFLNDVEAKFDLLLVTAIHDLELSPPAPEPAAVTPPTPQPILPAATPIQLTAEHDAYWYWSHTTSATRGKLVLWLLGTAAVFYLFGRNNLIGKVIDLIIASMKK